uniref:Gustatory receptor n=1 Tax=Anopheles epiroticus TaxID=199890 RepID=A0A182PDR7_9DIPT
MQVLNIFHALLICNVRAVRRHRGRPLLDYKISQARVQLLLPLLAISILAFHQPWITGRQLLTGGLYSFTVYCRVLTTLLIAILLIFDNFRQRYQLLGLLHAIPNLAMTGRIVTRKWNHRLTVKRLQLSVLVVCNVLSVLELVLKIYQSRTYFFILGIVCGLLVEHYILLNSLLCQLLAEALANAYNTLRQTLPLRPFTTVIQELAILENCKNCLSKVVGLKLVLVLLHLLFNVSFCTYDILQKILSQQHLDNITRLSIIALQETVMLFGLCFHYGMVNLKVVIQRPISHSADFSLTVGTRYTSCHRVLHHSAHRMDELKILNLFNRFLVSPVHLHHEKQTERYIFRHRNFARNIAILSSLILVCGASALVLVFDEFSGLLSTVMGVITIILYAIRLIVFVPMIIWTLANGRALVEISNRALNVERQFATSRSVDGTVSLLTKVQICIAIVNLFLNFALQFYYMYAFAMLRRLIHVSVVFGFLFVELFIFVHRAYVQYWPAFLSHRYVKLIQYGNYKDRSTLQTVILLSGVLESFKQRVNCIFGVMQLLHLLNIFVTCSVEAYIVFHVIDRGLNVYGTVINLFNAVAYSVSFLIYTYAHNLVNEKFLNVFNFCFVSPTYLYFDIQNNRYEFRYRGVFRNMTLLIGLVAINSIGATVMVLQFMQDQLDSVIGACNIILTMARLSVMVSLILWLYLFRHKLMNVCTFALCIVQEKYTQLYQKSKIRRKTCLAYWVQVCTIILFLIAAVVGDVSIWWRIIKTHKEYYILNLCAYIILDFVALMHLTYTQCLTLVIAQPLVEFVWIIKNEPDEADFLQTVTTYWDDMECFKQQITSTFGITSLLHVLDALVKCAIETYVIFYTHEMGLGLVGAFLDIVTLLLCTGSFFVFTYAHDLVTLLNVFNYCLVSPTYLHFDILSNRYTFRNRNVFWNVILLTVLSTISLIYAVYLVMEVLLASLGSVMTTTTLLLYMVRFLAFLPLIPWLILYRHRLCNDCAFALNIIQQKHKQLYHLSKPIVHRQRRKTLQLFWIEIGSIAFLLGSGLLMQIIIVWNLATDHKAFYILNLGVLVCMIFVTLMHLMYTQSWILVISLHLEELVWLIKNKHLATDLLRTLISFWDDLEAFKQQITATFGIMNALHMLDILVTCAIQSYSLIYFFEQSLEAVVVFLSIIILVLYIATFFVFAYVHDLVEAKFLNVFNHCFVSPTYLCYDARNNCYDFRFRNIFRNLALLIALLASSLVCVFVVILEFMDQPLASVLEASSIILYTMRLAVIVPLILWIWLCRHKLLSDCRFLLTTIQGKSFDLHEIPHKSRSLQIHCLQIGCIVFSLTTALVAQSAVWWEIVTTSREYYVFNLFGLVALEILTLMHRMYTQCWTMIISHHLEELLWLIKNKQLVPDLLRTIVAFWDELEVFKQRTTSTFGAMNVLHALDILVTCAIEGYTIFYIYGMGIGFTAALLNIVTLSVYATTFFMFAYAHDLVEVKLKFLNLFNHLLISPTYLYIDPPTNRSMFRNRNNLRNTLILSILLVVCIVTSSMTLLRYNREILQTVATAVSTILYTIRMIIVFLLLLWTMLNYRQLKDCSNHALHIVTRMRDRLNCSAPRRHDLFVLKVHTYINSIVLIVVLCLHTHTVTTIGYMFDIEYKILVYGFTLIEFVLSMHRVYVQFWATFLRLQYGELMMQVDGGIKSMIHLQEVLAFATELEEFKCQVANIFGPVQLLHVAQIFVTCASKSYLGYYLLSAGYEFRDSFSNWLTVIINAGLFLSFTRDFDAVEVKVSYEILNVFNHLFISIVYVDQTLKGPTVRHKNVLRNIFILLSSVSIFCYLGLKRTLSNYHFMVGSVQEIVHLLKYSLNGQLTYTLLSGMYTHSFKVIAILNEAIAIDRTIQQWPIAEAFFTVRHKLLKTLIALIILVRGSFFMMHLYLQFRYNLAYDVYMLLHGNVLIELSMDLQKLFLLYFALYMAQRYHVLLHLLDRTNLTTMVPVYEVFENLTTFKKNLSKTFGLQLLALVLQTFVACSIHAYLILVERLYVFQLIANVIQLLVNLALFFILTYYYDYVEIKEAELKDALKSMQYTNLKRQSRDQKDFYDLVNLKLMMESPKITACGLFEINLQIFYNVFAAIITYIVILFQFRGPSIGVMVTFTCCATVPVMCTSSIQKNGCRCASRYSFHATSGE